MLINELAQWAAILFVGIVGIGLTRQLGHFLVSRREQLEYEGPDVSKILPATLFTPYEFTQVESLAVGSVSGVTAALVMSDKCAGCVQALEILDSRGRPEGVPLVAVVGSSSPSFHRHVERLFDVVSQDVELHRAADVGIHATPFVMLVDRDLRVVKKAITADVRQVVAAWLNEHRGTDRSDGATASNGAASQDALRPKKVPA